MKLFIINVLLLALVTSSLGDGVRLGGRKEWPMAEEIEVEEVDVDTETVVPTSIIGPPAEETVVPTFMDSFSTYGETCCSCPHIPEEATEEEICLILEGMDEDCDSICEEDGGDGPNRQRNLTPTKEDGGDGPILERNLQYMTIGDLPWYTPRPTTDTPRPTTDPCAGPRTKRRLQDGPRTKRRLQYSTGCLSMIPSKPKTCVGAIKFIDCDLSQVRWIPEDDGKGGNSMPPHPMPGNDIWYHSDGLCFFNTVNFWKIPDHCEVKFECKGKKLKVLPPGANGGWRFSVQPKVKCEPRESCVIWATHQTPWPQSVPTPQWHPNYNGNPGWPDCTNATSWVGGGGGGVPSF